MADQLQYHVSLHHDFQIMTSLVYQRANQLYWHSKPDYASLLTQKYNDEFIDGQEVAPAEQIAAKGSHPDASENRESDSSDDDDVNDSKIGKTSEERDAAELLEGRARGRHQSEAASLRISKIEKILSKRTDLTRQQRRKLQSRKNTANFRERQRNTNKLNMFINYELDAIINMVSTCLCKGKRKSLVERSVCLHRSRAQRSSVCSKVLTFNLFD